MSRRVVVFAVFASTLLIALAYVAVLLPGEPPAAAPWLMIIGLPTLMVSTMALGAMRHDQVGQLALPFSFAWSILVVGFSLALLLPPESAQQPLLFLGLPRRAAIVLLGVGLLPLFAMPIAYALTFDRSTLSEEELRSLRAQARRLQQDEAPAPLVEAGR